MSKFGQRLFLERRFRLFPRPPVEPVPGDVPVLPGAVLERKAPGAPGRVQTVYGFAEFESHAE